MTPTTSTKFFPPPPYSSKEYECSSPLLGARFSYPCKALEILPQTFFTHFATSHFSPPLRFSISEPLYRIRPCNEHLLLLAPSPPPSFSGSSGQFPLIFPIAQSPVFSSLNPRAGPLSGHVKAPALTAQSIGSSCRVGPRVRYPLSEGLQNISPERNFDGRKFPLSLKPSLPKRLIIPPPFAFLGGFLPSPSPFSLSGTRPSTIAVFRSFSR